MYAMCKTGGKRDREVVLTTMIIFIRSIFQISAAKNNIIDMDITKEDSVSKLGAVIYRIWLRNTSAL